MRPRAACRRRVAGSLLMALCQSNPAAFHRTDAAGYVFWADRVIEVDAINPQLAARLARARRILLELREDIQAFYRDCHPTRDLIELRNAVQTALLVVHAAGLNPVSRGCHYVTETD